MKSQELKIRRFFWGTEKGWKIYKALKACAEDYGSPIEDNFVAKALLNDGHPSAIGYELRMNAYYMEHFINIVTNY